MRVARAANSRPPSRASPNNIAREGSGGGRGSGSSAEGSAAQQGADWTVAVACLRLLARPKEQVMASALGVFDVFARARGDRALHARRLEQERLERERQELLAEERERWKRRRRREQERGVAPSAQVSSGPSLPGTHFPVPLGSCRRKAGYRSVHQDGGERGGVLVASFETRVRWPALNLAGLMSVVLNRSARVLHVRAPLVAVRPVEPPYRLCLVRFPAR